MKNFNDAQAYFDKKVSGLSTTTINAYRSGGLKLINGQLYVAREVSVGGGKIEILPSSVNREVGITNFDKNQLNDQRNLVVTKMAVKYDASGTDSSKEREVKYATALPGSHLNAELHVLQDGKKVFSAPLSTFSAESAVAKVGDDYKELDSFFLLEENKITEVVIDYPAGAAAHASNKEYVKVIFSGLETVKA